MEASAALWGSTVSLSIWVVIVLSLAWMFLRTGHGLGWAVPVLGLPLLTGLTAVFWLPAALVDGRISQETFYVLNGLSGLPVAVFLAFLGLKRWPVPTRSNAEVTL